MTENERHARRLLDLAKLARKFWLDVPKAESLEAGAAALREVDGLRGERDALCEDLKLETYRLNEQIRDKTRICAEYEELRAKLEAERDALKARCVAAPAPPPDEVVERAAREIELQLLDAPLIGCERAKNLGLDAARALADAGLLLSSPKQRPRIVCLCGSTRFYDEFQRANYEETMAGRIVLSVGFYPHNQERAHGEAVGCTAEQKIALDELHKRKIDLADEVFVLNVGGYIGDSTRSEIAHAEATGKPVRYLEPRADAGLLRAKPTCPTCGGAGELLKMDFDDPHPIKPCPNCAKERR